MAVALQARNPVPRMAANGGEVAAHQDAAGRLQRHGEHRRARVSDKGAIDPPVRLQPRKAQARCASDRRESTAHQDLVVSQHGQGFYRARGSGIETVRPNLAPRLRSAPPRPAASRPPPEHRCSLFQAFGPARRSWPRSRPLAARMWFAASPALHRKPLGS